MTVGSVVDEGVRGLRRFRHVHLREPPLPSVRTIVTVVVISAATYVGIQHFTKHGVSSTALRAGR